MKKLRLLLFPLALFLLLVFARTGFEPKKIDPNKRSERFSNENLNRPEQHSLWVEMRGILSEDLDFSVVQDTLRNYFPVELLQLAGDVKAVKISEVLGLAGRFDFESEGQILSMIKKMEHQPGIKIHQSKTDEESGKFAASLSAELKIPGQDGKTLKLKECCIRMRMA